MEDADQLVEMHCLQLPHGCQEAVTFDRASKTFTACSQIDPYFASACQRSSLTFVVFHMQAW
jgi:hypothetical protein